MSHVLADGLPRWQCTPVFSAVAVLRAAAAAAAAAAAVSLHQHRAAVTNTNASKQHHILWQQPARYASSLTVRLLMAAATASCN